MESFGHLVIEVDISKGIMKETLNDTKQFALATRLAEIKAFQQKLIHTNQILLNAVEDNHIRQQLQEVLEQDQKNLVILDATIKQCRTQGELSSGVEKGLQTIQNFMENPDFSLTEKVFRYELLKHQQTVAGEVLYKAAQLLGDDVARAIAPIYNISFESHAHQEKLKAILEVLGVQELTGQEPNQSFWARGEDAIATVSGVVGSVLTRTDDEMSIRDLLLMDHSKTDVLFAEILGSENPQRIWEYFGQLYQDVRVHGLAEEEVLYPALQPYYDQMPEIIDQTDHVIEMLDAMKLLDPTASDFKAHIQDLRLAVRNHINQEEHDIFPKIKENLSHEQQKQLATEFKAAKSKLQKRQQGHQ